MAAIASQRWSGISSVRGVRGRSSGMGALAEGPLQYTAIRSVEEPDELRIRQAELRRRRPHDGVRSGQRGEEDGVRTARRAVHQDRSSESDRKSTRLNSSHEWISYAVF